MKDPEFQAWIDRARGVDLESAAGIAGARLRKAGGAEMVGPCPRCGGTDRFSINIKRAVWNCRQSEGGNDSIGLLQHCLGLPFVEACEMLTGDPPPQAEKGPSRPYDASGDASISDRRQDDRIAREISETEDRRKKRARIEEILSGGEPLFGSRGMEYYRARGIVDVPASLFGSARYFRSMLYKGYIEGGDSEQDLGEWPCIVWPMVDLSGAPVGVHRTYLDRAKPIKRAVEDVRLSSGSTAKNLAKKMFGAKGLIRIGDVRPVMAVAEGVENALSWYALGYGPDDLGIAAAGDLGNLGGRALGQVPHPKYSTRTVPNGEPDPDYPGMAVPDGVEELLLLGDSDSDRAFTRMVLVTAGRRHLAAGRRVSVHMPPQGKDWNDVLLDRVGAKP